MKKGLFALALGTFTLGMAEFIIEGILTDVAHNMNVSIPQVGHLISIYALGVCAGAFSLILCSFLYLVDYIVSYSYCKLTIIFSIPNSTCQSSILFLVSIYILHSSS